MNIATATISAVLVPDSMRVHFLPYYFGMRHMMRGEAIVFGWLGHLCEKYSGGEWAFYELDNGGFYMAPKLSGVLVLSCNGNGNQATVTADAAGIIATLFALSQLMIELHGTADDQDEPFIKAYCALSDFAAAHVECAEISNLID